MKTFLNVLYRRILYKIPLKFLLILIVIFGILFLSFSNALTLNNSNYPGEFEYQHTDNFRGTRNIKQYYNYNHDGISCIFVENNNNCSLNDGDNTIYGLLTDVAYCTDSNTLILTCNDTTAYYYYIFLGDNWLKQWYPDYTSLQCQTEYNLIPVDSVDENYCTSNNLCPSCGPVDCPNVGVSNVFINDLFHPGAFNIIMNIPEEIDWDYAYTNSGNNMNIDVVGYNVDYEKIDNIINNQSYVPTQEDFNSLILVLVPYTKIIIAFLVILLIWARVKKPFKSKKL